MKQLLNAVGRFALWQKLIVGAMLLLVIVTWLAACLVVVGLLPV